MRLKIWFLLKFCGQDEQELKYRMFDLPFITWKKLLIACFWYRKWYFKWFFIKPKAKIHLIQPLDFWDTYRNKFGKTLMK